jgi:hypothetical protein
MMSGAEGLSAAITTALKRYKCGANKHPKRQAPHQNLPVCQRGLRGCGSFDLDTNADRDSYNILNILKDIPRPTEWVLG